MGRYPWGGFFMVSGVRFDSGDCQNQPLNRTSTMNSYLKSYGLFLAFAIATHVVVAPLAKQMGIPFVQDL